MKKLFLFQKVGLIIFGIILCCVLLEIGLRIAGHVYLAMNANQLSCSMQKDNEITILCLGESTTYQQWPQYVQEYLAREQVRAHVVDAGKIGANSAFIFSLARYETVFNKFSERI